MELDEYISHEFNVHVEAYLSFALKYVILCLELQIALFSVVVLGRLRLWWSSFVTFLLC